MKPPPISEGELLGLIGGAIKEGDYESGVTAEYLARTLGHTRNTISNRLRPLIEQGKISVRRCYRTSVIGRRYETFLYSLKGSKK